jgi:dihydroorotate dehydrogenase electron transfer subunit
LTVLAHAAVTGEYRHLVLQAERPMTLARPGQFFHLLCTGEMGMLAPFFRRPMSAYLADPSSGRLEFLYKVNGRGTRALAALQPGEELNVLGPLGRGFRLDPSWKNIVVVGRGVGLATLAPLAEAAAAQRIKVTAILSARRPDLLMSAERFQNTGARVLPVYDSDGSSAPEEVEKLLDRLIASRLADAFFVCGSQRLLRLLQRFSETHAIPGQVALEQQMACGLGMCFCCVRPFREDGKIAQRRVCWEGPVFNLQEALA